MIVIKGKGVKELEKALITFAGSRLQRVLNDTVTGMAVTAMREGRKIVRSEMILKNRLTEQLIQFTPATKGSPVAITGAAAQSPRGDKLDYLKTQEQGGTVNKTGKQGVPLVTTAATGEGRGTRPRRKLSLNVNRRRNIQLLKATGGRVKNRKQRNAMLINMAKDQGGSQYIYLDLGRKKGVFGVYGNQLTMIYDLSRPSVAVPKHEWLLPAAQRAIVAAPRIYNAVIVRHIRATLGKNVRFV